MKKLLFIAILMLALVITAVACTGDKNPEDTTIGDTTVETPTEAPTAEPDDPTEAPTAEPDDPTEAPTVEPEDPTEAPTAEPDDPTEAPTAEPEQPTEPETEDPMAPINVFEAADIQTITGGDPNNLTQNCVSIVDNYLHIVPIGADPYWYPFSSVDGGRYVAIRYRTDATGADMQLYMGSSGSGPSDDSTMIRQPVIADGEWNLMVFDTQSLIDAGKYDGKFVSYFRFDALEAGYILDENGEPYKDESGWWARYTLPEGCFIDVEYIAFFNSREAAEAYDFKINPPYIDADNPDAGKKNHSFDTFYVNGSMYFPEDGGAGDKLAAQNNTVTFGMDDLCDSMMLRGWIGFTQPIASFGYYIDSYKMIYKDFATATEDGVKAAGGEHASRFEILVPLAELDGGVHTVGFVAMLEDGTVVRLREELQVVIVPYHKDETLILGIRDGGPFITAGEKKFGQRGQIGENILKKVTILDLATYADGNTNTWSFKVWQWNTDYATTVAGTPLFTHNGENHQDNLTFSIDIPVDLFIGGDIFYEIEYLTGSGTFTGWVAKDVTPGLETYVNGELRNDSYAASITVGVKAERPENPDEETMIDVSGEGSTQVVFGEIYEDADKGTLFDGNLHIEKNLGPAYFDGVRTNDWMEFKINVETAGDYDVCMVFGWLDHTGVYTILMDGAEVGKIENTIPGTDWRVWMDSSSIKINLTEGEHTVRVVMGSDGPNVYGVKFTYAKEPSDAPAASEQ